MFFLSRRCAAHQTKSLTVTSLIALGLLCLGQSGSAAAQAPIALPNTITTIAGGATGGGSAITGGVLPTKGAACSAGSPYTATDALGDGCPGLNTVFSSDFRGGLQVDASGNVFIMDTTNSLLRRIDARTGIVTAVTGTATTGCTTSTDSYGDGCPFAQTKLGTARGVTVDPYGNVLIAGYGMQTINLLCNAVSPLCPNTTGHKQVGSMYRIAGCVAAATSTGTTGTGTAAGNTGDGYAATPYGNLAADVADWGTGSSAYGSCTAAATTTIAAVASPRGVAADRYGNVYIAETGTSGAGYRYRVVVGPATFTLPNGTVLNNAHGGHPRPESQPTPRSPRLPRTAASTPSSVASQRATATPFRRPSAQPVQALPAATPSTPSAMAALTTRAPQALGNRESASTPMATSSSPTTPRASSAFSLLSPP